MSVNTFSIGSDICFHSSGVSETRNHDAFALEQELKLARDLMQEADRIMRVGSRLMEYAMRVETAASRRYSDKVTKRVELNQF
jgi:hypothetical protein